jgi:hypothetical protein
LLYSAAAVDSCPTIHDHAIPKSDEESPSDVFADEAAQRIRPIKPWRLLRHDNRRRFSETHVPQSSDSGRVKALGALKKLQDLLWKAACP